jgi:hypothetical protein
MLLRWLTMLITLVVKRNSMGSKRKCAKAWKAWEKGYAKKQGGKEEAAKEKREFYCDNGIIKLRPSDDADVPYTDDQIKEMK